TSLRGLLKKLAAPPMYFGRTGTSMKTTRSSLAHSSMALALRHINSYRVPAAMWDAPSNLGMGSRAGLPPNSTSPAHCALTAACRVEPYREQGLGLELNGAL